MKATSKLIIVAVVILIMVALVSLTYNFTLNITPRSVKAVSFTAASCDETLDGVRAFRFTIRNAGSEVIGASEIAVFLDGSMMEESPPFYDISPDNVDQERTFINKTAAQGKAGDHVIMVSAPGGDVSRTVKCT